jgi:hypothetical protein
VPNKREEIENVINKSFFSALKILNISNLKHLAIIFKRKTSTANVKEVLLNKTSEQANNPFVTRRIPVQLAQAQRRWSISDPSRRIIVTNQYLNAPPSPVKSSASFPKFEGKDIYRSLSDEEFPRKAEQRFSLTTHVIEESSNKNKLILDPYDPAVNIDNNIMNNTFRLKRLSNRIVNTPTEGSTNLIFTFFLIL